MAAEPYGFAIVGCGVVAPYHAQAIQALPNATVRAFVDTNLQAAQRLAAAFGGLATTDLDTVLERDDIDVVCVTTPSGLHAEIGIACARAGKHVVVEKPIDVSLEAADRLIAACREAGVMLTVISQRRWDPGIQALRRVVERGEIGEVFIADVAMKWYRSQAYYDSAAWRGTRALDGGGALMNQGVHFVDLLLWLVGPVRRVYASCATVAHQIEVEDVAVVQLEFVNGARGVIEATTAAYPGLDERIEVTGTSGTARLEKGQVTLWKAPDGPVSITVSDHMSAAADHAALPVENHRRQLADFLEALEYGRDPMVTPQQARSALEVILAVYRSSQLGQPVALPLDVMGAGVVHADSPMTGVLGGTHAMET